MNRKQKLALSGSGVLFVGVFLPFISVPFLGSINYFRNGEADGVIVLGLAIVSLVLTLIGKYGGLWLTGAGSLAVLGYTFVSMQMGMSDARASGDMFDTMLVETMQLSWGFAVMIVGACLLLGAAATTHRPVSARS